MTLLFLESLGTSELLVILVVALIIFGPRKLPELGRSLGKGLGEFKRASDEFKQTWEREVNLDSDRERKVGEAMLPPESRPAELPATTAENSIASPSGIAAPVGAQASEDAQQTIARGAVAATGDAAAAAHTATIDQSAPPPFDPNATATGATASDARATDASAAHEAGEAAPQSPQHKTEWL